MRRLFLVLVLVCLFLENNVVFCQQVGEKVHIRTVIDGDTVKLSDGRFVRFIGIDCPEMHESKKLDKDASRTGASKSKIKAKGRRAYIFTKNLIGDKDVIIEPDETKKDDYNRTLAYVWYKIDNYNDVNIPADYEIVLKDNSSRGQDHYLFVNATIIKAGYAYTMPIKPNLKYAGLFYKLYKEAKEEKRGLWGGSGE